MRRIKSWWLLVCLALVACSALRSAPVQETAPGTIPTQANPIRTSTPPPGSIAWQNAVWALESLGNPAKPELVLPGTQITVLFNSSNSTVSGSAGCNTYSGSYRLDGYRLNVSSLAATLMACDQPIMDQEGVYLKALQSATSYQFKEGKLQITYAGSQVLNFIGAQSGEPAFEDTLWKLEAFGDQSTVTNLLPNTQITATFTRVVGKVAGSAGCNHYSALYRVDGEKLSVETPATTKTACPQPVLDQETAFLHALESAQSFTVQGGVLKINCAGGKVLVFIPVG